MTEAANAGAKWVMPYAFLGLPISTTTVIVVLQIVILLCVLLMRPQGPKVIQAPSEERLKKAEDAAKYWLEVTSGIAGWKAAIYGGLGVVVGALGGLMADYVISGHMAASAWVRAAKVIGVLATVVTVLIVTLEHFKVLEKMDARRRDRRGKRGAAVEKVD